MRSRLNQYSLSLAALSFTSSLAAQSSAQGLELVLRGGAFTPTDGDENVSTLGMVGGATALYVSGDHFAVGPTFDHAYIPWSAPAPDDGFNAPHGIRFPDDEGSMRSTLLALAARWYLAGHSTLAPYLQVAPGYV